MIAAYTRVFSLSEGDAARFGDLKINVNAAQVIQALHGTPDANGAAFSAEHGLVACCYENRVKHQALVFALFLAASLAPIVGFRVASHDSVIGRVPVIPMSPRPV